MISETDSRALPELSGRIFLVRHGQTAGNGRSYVGWQDLPLNAVGRAQAQAVRVLLADARIDAVYASPLIRALATARPLAEQRGLPVHARDELKEIDYGQYQGLSKTERRLRLRDDYRFAPLPGGESLFDVYRRAVGMLQAVCDNFSQFGDELWHSPLRRFRMPQPIGVDADLGMRWEARVAGRRIDDLFSEVRLDSLLESVAHALVGLHAVPIANLPWCGVTQVLRQLERKALPRIQAALAPLYPEAAALYQALAQQAAALPTPRARTIHGDFHTANLLLDHEDAALIDLDNLAHGDPAYDLALFGSRLLLATLQRGERVDEAVNTIAALPQAYAAAGGDPVPARTFAWYMAAMLVGRQIRACIRHAAPGLEELAPLLLSYARATLARGRFEPSLGDEQANRSVRR